MENHRFKVPNITCGHCVAAIQKELTLLEGVRKVGGDPDKKEIEVAFEPPATLEGIKRTLADINYPAQ